MTVNEIWKDIEEYQGLYKVSNFGRIKNKKEKINLLDYINKRKEVAQW